MLNSFNRPMILIFKMPIVFDLLYFQENRREGGSSGAWRTQPFLIFPVVVRGCVLAVLCLPSVFTLTHTLPVLPQPHMLQAFLCPVAERLRSVSRYPHSSRRRQKKNLPGVQVLVKA